MHRTRDAVLERAEVGQVELDPTTDHPKPVPNVRPRTLTCPFLRTPAPALADRIAPLIRREGAPDGIEANDAVAPGRLEVGE